MKVSIIQELSNIEIKHLSEKITKCLNYHIFWKKCDIYLLDQVSSLSFKDLYIYFHNIKAYHLISD